MKKVRYGLGAVGIVPALGVMGAVPPAAAAAHASVRPAKMVGLQPAVSTSVASALQTTCHAGSFLSALSGLHHFRFKIFHYGHCVDSQQGVLDHSQTGLSDRVRFYSKYGAMIAHRRGGGTIYKSNGTWKTFWPAFCFGCTPRYSVDNVNYVYMVCDALVKNNTNSVIYGPVCLKP